MAASAGWFLYYGKQVIKKLKNAGAISKDTAKTVKEVRINEREARSIGRLKLFGHIGEVKLYFVVGKPGGMEEAILNKLRDAGAISKETAKPIEELDLKDTEAKLLEKNEERWRSVGSIKKYYVKKDP